MYLESGEHRLLSCFLAHSLLLNYRSIYKISATKVIFSILEQAMNAQREREREREWRYSSTLSLTLALGWGGWSTSCPGHFTPGKKPGTHCTGGWLGPRAGLTGAEDVPPVGIRGWDCLKKA